MTEARERDSLALGRAFVEGLTGMSAPSDEYVVALLELSRRASQVITALEIGRRIARPVTIEARMDVEERSGYFEPTFNAVFLIDGERICVPDGHPDVVLEVMTDEHVLLLASVFPGTDREAVAESLASQTWVDRSEHPNDAVLDVLDRAASIATLVQPLSSVSGAATIQCTPASMRTPSISPALAP